ncbi:uncharacterized protein [Watersipora subatra]|uniref:uncharacterized protein n=1 Tax=Watersipora subatra TaxID=2589382 RepID=UPI00355B1FAD
MAAAQAIHVLAGVFYLEPVPQCTGSLKLHELSSGDKHTNQAAVSDDASFDSQKNNNPNERPVEKEEIKTTPTVAEEVKDKSSYIRLLKREFITILKSINVWLFLVHSLLHGANSSSFFILINDYIFHHTSLTKDEVAIGITILGFSNVAGCLVVVASSALKYNRLVSQGTFILIYAVATIIMAFTSNKTMFYFLCGCWGIGKGCSIANLLASVSQICQTEQLGLTLGLALLCEGIGSLTGTSLISFVAQDLQQQAAVILSGCLGVAGSSCLIPIVVRKYRERQKTRANNNIEWDNAAYIN